MPVVEVPVVEDGTEPSAEPTPEVKPKTSTYWLYLHELKAFALQAIPLIVTQASHYLTYSIALMFCGRMNKIDFNGAVLATTLISAFGSAVATGLTTACDTLFSQIFGSTTKKKLGVVLIRSMLILGLSSFIPMAVFINIERVLLWLHQDPGVVRAAAKYLLIFCPGLLGLFLYLPLSKYLQNQNKILSSMFIGFLANGINIGLHLLLVVHFDYGITGSAIALSSSYFGFTCLTIAYILIFKVHKDTWSGWSAECLLDWSQMYELAWFGLIMTCIEWWVYEAGLILAGVIGITELACQSIIVQVSLYTFVVYTGLSTSVNIRVGQYLGADDKQGAIRSFRLILVISGFVSCFFAAMVYGFRNFIPRIFTHLPEVNAMTASVLPWYALCTLFEGTFLACGGILRGSGRQRIGSLVTFICYMVGLAIAIPLMLKTQMVEAFWKGMAVAMAVDSVILVLICMCTKWQKQTRQAVKRASIATLVGSDGSAKIPTRVYIRTAAVVTAVLGLLIVSIFIRIYFPPENNVINEEYNNSTRIYDDM